MTDSRSAADNDGATDPPLGRLLRQRLLGSEATYRVVGRNERGIEVEVVDAPGLPPGSRFTFLPGDVNQMDQISG